MKKPFGEGIDSPLISSKMKTLITPVEVLKIAFGGGEYLASQSVAEADIAAAEQCHIVPVTGRALYERLLAGAYADFTAGFLAAPLALFTRLQIQPRLDVRTGRCGTVAPDTAWVRPADAEARRSLMRSLRTEARALLRRASEHLAAHRDAFPEYDPANDILNRCTTDGRVVQIR